MQVILPEQRLTGILGKRSGTNLYYIDGLIMSPAIDADKKMPEKNKETLANMIKVFRAMFCY